MTKQEQAIRLYKAVEKLVLQAGEDTDEAIDWLCGEHGGMFKLYEAYFSSKPAQQEAQIVRWNCPCGNKYTFRGFTEAPAQRKPLTDKEIDALREQHSEGRGAGWRFDFKGFARAIEAAHGIKE